MYIIENRILNYSDLKETIYNLYFVRDKHHKKIIDYFKDKYNLYILNIENTHSHDFLHEIVNKLKKNPEKIYFDKNDNICNETDIDLEYINNVKLIIDNLIKEFNLDDIYSQLFFKEINKTEIEKHKYLI